MPHLSLIIALTLLTIDSAIELSFISSIVGYLHRSGANEYPFRNPENGDMILVNAKPKNLLVNQGHTSNGAAGTALILVCFGGFLVLWWVGRQRRSKTNNNTPSIPSPLFLIYTTFTILSFLLTTAALAYTFIIAHQTSSQSIIPSIASANQHKAYPLHNWAPGTWTEALLKLDLSREEDRKYLEHWLSVMKGYEYNLIVMFLLGGTVAGLAAWEVVRMWSGYGVVRGGRGEAEKGEQGKSVV